jgi:putative acetyltransferase
MIRAAQAGDHAGVRAVLIAAFPTPEEADLVERLRADGDVPVELVAEENGPVIGHVFLSNLVIERPDGQLHAAALAPVSVMPARQGSGVGSALIRTGIDQCKALGLKAILVVGHPSYYPRFGFSHAAAESLDAPFSGPAFMALELEPGALRAGGRVRYAKAFGV